MYRSNTKEREGHQQEPQALLNKLRVVSSRKQDLPRQPASDDSAVQVVDVHASLGLPADGHLKGAI